MKTDQTHCFRVKRPTLQRDVMGWRLSATMLDYQHIADIGIGEELLSSPLRSVDFERGIAVTKNSIYVWEV